VSAHPLFLHLEGRLVLVVGGGPVACDKACGLVQCGARVRVVAPQVRAELHAVAETVHLRGFEPADLDGVWLVIAAAPPEVNRQVRLAADERQRFVVAVDDVANCSAIGAACLRRGPLTFALSSDGVAPALVSLLRQGLDALLPADLDEWVKVARTERAVWKADKTPFALRRPRLLAALTALYDGQAVEKVTT
jgi:siroheme synthase-like protein